MFSCCSLTLSGYCRNKGAEIKLLNKNYFLLVGTCTHKVLMLCWAYRSHSSLASLGLVSVHIWRDSKMLLLFHQPHCGYLIPITSSRLCSMNSTSLGFRNSTCGFLSTQFSPQWSLSTVYEGFVFLQWWDLEVTFSCIMRPCLKERKKKEKMGGRGSEKEGGGKKRVKWS